jgi:hypothetical protein
MKVICINNYEEDFKGWPFTNRVGLVVGGIYEAKIYKSIYSGIFEDIKDRYLVLIDGDYKLFYKERFILLKELRKEKLEKLKSI